MASLTRQLELVNSNFWQLELEPELCFGLQRLQARPRTPSLAELPLHFFSGVTHLFTLRKLALRRCELELLRSHPKDERGSVREIGLWMLCAKPCISAGYSAWHGDFLCVGQGGHFRLRSGDHFGVHLGIISELTLRPFRSSFWTEN